MESQLLTPEQLQQLTYSPPSPKDFTLDDNLSPLPQDWSYVARRSKQGLPLLDRLPPELFQIIISQLDLLSLYNFGRASGRAAQLLSSHPQYDAITTHAPNAFFGALRIKTGHTISCQELYKKLCTRDCEDCGDFGGYLYLLTFKRVCFLCFSEGRLYFPVRPGLACRKYGISREVVDELPRMSFMQGTYSPSKIASPQDVLVDSESALAAGLEAHGSSENLVSVVVSKEMQRALSRLRRSTQDGPQDISDPSIDPDEINLRFCDARASNPHRFGAIVRAPWFDRSTRRPELGFHCLGCKGLEEEPLHWRRRFTAESFVEHLSELRRIKLEKHSRPKD
ncbi:hypothetical protein ACJ41O_007723 [Fusarium nematophilum]